MADRTLTYEVKVDATQAQRAAREVRATFERELAINKTGPGWRTPLIDTRDTVKQVKAAVAGAEAEVAKAASRAGPGGLLGKLLTGVGGVTGSSLLGAMGGAFTGGLAAGAIGMVVRQLGQALTSSLELGTGVRRTSEAFTVLSGGAANAADKLAAVQNASGGAIDKLQAMQIANKSAALGLANTASELSRVTRFATIAGRIMGMDTAATLDNIAMAASNLSFRRLDQMGISAEKTKKIFNELKGSMDESQAFLEAMLRVGEETFAGLNNSAVTAASGVEMLKTRLADLKQQAAERITLKLDPFLRDVAIAAGGGSSEDQLQYLREVRERAGRDAMTAHYQSTTDQAKALDAIIPLTKQANELMADGVHGAGALGDELRAIGAKAAQGITSPEMFARLSELTYLLGLMEAQAINTGYAMDRIRPGGLNPGLVGYDAGSYWNALQQMGYNYIPAEGSHKDPFLVRAEVDKEVAADKKAAEKETERARLSGIRTATSDWKRATEQMARDFESALRGVPGLFGTSEVTDADMAAAKAGVYQPKADEYLRRLRDEVAQNKDLYGDVDIQDAARRAGISGALPPEVILSMFESKWANQSLFANAGNLDLINQDAVRQALAEQEASRLGQQNILSLFGQGTARADTIAGTSGGATAAGAAGLGGDLAPALKQQLADLPKDQTLIDGAQNVGKTMAREVAGGWEKEIGNTAWAAQMVSIVTANVVKYFEAAGATP
jgi:hypothetical protein